MKPKAYSESVLPKIPSLVRVCNADETNHSVLNAMINTSSAGDEDERGFL
jgi:hypothetical protein